MLQIGYSHGILPFNAQFDDQFPHIDGRRTGEAERLAADRVEESELGRVQGLTTEIEPGKKRPKPGGRASIHRIAQ